LISLRNINTGIIFTGTSPCLKVKVNIVRDFSQLILRIYIPSVFLVILGWMSMWIDKGQVGARTSLGVLCVLSIVTQLVGVVSVGAGLEGLIAVDIWMAVCMFFTIMALCVFAVVHNMKRRKDKRKDKTKQKYKVATFLVLGSLYTSTCNSLGHAIVYMSV
jgi:NADH:ubiquinone oxidoreductase subunit 2 (subunit N)